MLKGGAKNKTGTTPAWWKVLVDLQAMVQNLEAMDCFFKNVLLGGAGGNATGTPRGWQIMKFLLSWLAIYRISPLGRMVKPLLS